MTALYDVRVIMEYLPHRYPFVMIDRVLSMEPGKQITALKNVTINEHFFQGHFPGTPVMPGVLILEGLGQAGGMLVMESLPPERRGSLVYFMGMDKVRFRHPVVPGDQLIFEVQMLKFRSKVVKMTGSASVEGVLAAEGEMMASIGEKP